MRKDRLDYQIVAHLTDKQAIRVDLHSAMSSTGVPLSDDSAFKVVEAISAFRALSQRPSSSKLEEQIGWIRKSAAELKRALGGDEFRDAFHFLKSANVLRDIHERLASIDSVLDIDAKGLAEEVKQGKHSLAPQWRTSRRGHLAIAVIEAYLDAFPDERTVSKRMRAFTAAVFGVAGESLSDDAVREILRSPLGGFNVVLKNKKPT